MIFKKDFLVDVLDSKDVVLDEIIENSRWSIHHRLVFKYDGKFYESYYCVGATESQDERPWEYDGDDIECKEVFPAQKTVTVYE